MFLSILGKKRALWTFVGVLGHSRYTMVRLVWTNSVGVTIEAMEHLLQELGGVPAHITSDNPKCFAIKACKYEPILNPIFERFGAHYPNSSLFLYTTKEKSQIFW
jgi:transposase